MTPKTIFRKNMAWPALYALHVLSCYVSCPASQALYDFEYCIYHTQ